MSLRPCSVALGATVFAAFFASASAEAALVTRTETSSAVKACQGALPAFEGALRKRPKAVQNEGTTPAFVTCGLEGRGLARSMSPNARRLQIFFVSNATSAVNVTCTATDAGALSGNPASTRTITVGAGGTQDSVLFLSTNLDPVNGRWYIPAVSCGLPPGIGVSQLWYEFVEENGA